MHLITVLDLPMGKFRDKGIPVDNVSNYDTRKEDVLLIEALQNMKDKNLLFATAAGMLKVVDGGLFDVSKRTTAATKLAEDDLVLRVGIVEEGDNVVMYSKNQYFLRIDAADIPEKKKAAVGVRGIRLEEGDSLKGVCILKPGDNPTVKVKSKSVQLGRLHVSPRDTKGVKK
jgi:DNA gyrase subunit A